MPYRLTLTLQEQAGRVSGVLTNLENRKAYALSGSFEQKGNTLTLDTSLFEQGNQHRGNLRGEVREGEFSGQLRTVLFGKELLSYRVTLGRVSSEGAAGRDTDSD